MPQWNQQEIAKLAQSLADTVKGVRPARTRLRVLAPPKPQLFDSITREACLARIRFLTRRYNLQWLLEQETFDTPGINCAPDAQVAAVLKALERARECIRDGVDFEDAGLVRDTTALLPPIEDDHHA